MKLEERVDWRSYRDRRDLLEERIRMLEERRDELSEAAAEEALGGECWMSLGELEAMAPQEMGNLRQVLRALSSSRESLQALKAAYARVNVGCRREVPGQLMLTLTGQAA